VRARLYKKIKDVEEIAIKIIIRFRELDIGSVQMGGDLRLGILMQMEKAKWSNCGDALR
jgi:hypothetical protein